MPLPLPSSESPGPDRPDAPLPRPPRPPLAAGTSTRGANGGTADLAPPSGPAATCYRHPDRPVGRRCTRCGKPACHECLRQAQVGSHCLDCVKAAKPDLRTRARFWQASKPAIVAYTFIALNVAAFVVLGLVDDLGGMLSGRITDAHLRFGLNEFFVDGDPGAYPLTDGSLEVSSGQEWYRLVTSGFLHFGLIHLLMNMYFLFLLGNQMEPMLGRVRFGGLYVASLLGGSAGIVLIDQGGIAAGASGAVFGLLGAYAVGVWQHGINVFSTQIGSLLLINLFLTFAIRNISIGGHIGGLVAGGLCGFVMLAPGYKGYPPWLRNAAPVVVGVAAVAVAVVGAG